MNVVFSERAKRDWQRIPKQIQSRLRKKLAFYLKNRSPFFYAETLKKFEFGEYRFRIGDYRIIFDKIERGIFILRIGHRKDIYN